MNFSRTRNAPIAFPGVTHQGALGAPSSGTAARPRRGIQISLGSGARSSCESPGGPCWDLGRAAASSLLTPLSSEETGMKSHPVRGEPGQGAGESQVSGGRSSGFPPRPGDTRGTPGLPRAVTLLVWTRVNPRGRFPGGRGGRSAASGSPAGPAPGAPPPGGLPARRDCAPPLPGVGEASPRRAEPNAPGAAGPNGPPHPWPRRRPA